MFLAWAEYVFGFKLEGFGWGKFGCSSILVLFAAADYGVGSIDSSQAKHQYLCFEWMDEHP